MASIFNAVIIAARNSKESLSYSDTEDDSRVNIYWKPDQSDVADVRNNLLRMLQYRIVFDREEDDGIHWSFPADWQSRQSTSSKLRKLIYNLLTFPEFRRSSSAVFTKISLVHPFMKTVEPHEILCGKNHGRTFKSRDESSDHVSDVLL